eukprot:4246379-Alexandrium_andersonii.AAC.1
MVRHVVGAHAISAKRLARRVRWGAVNPITNHGAAKGARAAAYTTHVIAATPAHTHSRSPRVDGCAATHLRAQACACADTSVRAAV